MIKLNDNYFIESDGTNFILKQKVDRVNKETKETYVSSVPLGYYGGNLDQALNGYAKHVMLDYTKDNDVCLLKVLDKLEEIKQEIKAYE